MASPLAGRVALVTGVSRRIGIGAAVARRLAADGATVVAAGWAPHDVEMPWGADDGGAPAEQVDFEDPAAPARLVDAVLEAHGGIDIVVATHARSSHTGLDEVTAHELDRCWAVNARASVLLAQALGRAHDPTRGGGRLVLFTSGQHLAPMSEEIAYAVSKGAIQQMTRSLADALADRGITVNCVNPGPVDTGWADDATRAAVAAAMPSGQWTTPDQTAAVVAWLVGDDAAVVTGQVVDAEAGYRRV